MNDQNDGVEGSGPLLQPPNDEIKRQVRELIIGLYGEKGYTLGDDGFIPEKRYFKMILQLMKKDDQASVVNEVQRRYEVCRQLNIKTDAPQIMTSLSSKTMPQLKARLKEVIPSAICTTTDEKNELQRKKRQMNAIRLEEKQSRWRATEDEVCAAVWRAIQDPDSVLGNNDDNVAATVGQQDDNSSDRSTMAGLVAIIDPTPSDDDMSMSFSAMSSANGNNAKSTSDPSSKPDMDADQGKTIAISEKPPPASVHAEDTVQPLATQQTTTPNQQGPPVVSTEAVPGIDMEQDIQNDSTLNRGEIAEAMSFPSKLTGASSQLKDGMSSANVQTPPKRAKPSQSVNSSPPSSTMMGVPAIAESVCSSRNAGTDVSSLTQSFASGGTSKNNSSMANGVNTHDEEKQEEQENPEPTMVFSVAGQATASQNLPNTAVDKSNGPLNDYNRDMPTLMRTEEDKFVAHGLSGRHMSPLPESSNQNNHDNDGIPTSARGGPGEDGSTMETFPRDDQTNPTEAERNKIWPWIFRIVVVIVLGIVAIVVAGFLVFGPSQDDPATDPPIDDGKPGESGASTPAPAVVVEPTPRPTPVPTRRITPGVTPMPTTAIEHSFTLNSFINGGQSLKCGIQANDMAGFVSRDSGNPEGFEVDLVSALTVVGDQSFTKQPL